MLPPYTTSEAALLLTEPIFQSRFEVMMKEEGQTMKTLHELMSFTLTKNKLTLKCTSSVYTLNSFLEEMSKKSMCEIGFHKNTGEITDVLIGFVTFDNFLISGDYELSGLLTIDLNYSFNPLTIAQQTGALNS